MPEVNGGHGQGEVPRGARRRPQRSVGRLDDFVVLVGHLAAAADIVRDDLGYVRPGKGVGGI